MQESKSVIKNNLGGYFLPKSDRWGSFSRNHEFAGENSDQSKVIVHSTR